MRLFQRRHFHQNPATGSITDVIQTWVLIPGTGVWVLAAVQPIEDGTEVPA